MFRRGYLLACLRKWRKMTRELLACKSNEHGQWTVLSLIEEEDGSIPEDVPKGHMVVYVGEERKRYVIRVTFLQHPLFRALLDRAREVYEFNPDAKLRIPCDESIFTAILHYVSSQQAGRFWMCF